MFVRNTEFPFLPKDFIETAEGLIFAVVSYHAQQQKVGCFLRYVRQGSQWQKIATEQANQLLESQYPQYLYHSKQFDAAFHAVEITAIVKHHQPEQRLLYSLANDNQDCVEVKLKKLIAILLRYGADCQFLGLTGSMLIDQQRAQSDIDLVVYGREQFAKTRRAVQQALACGELDALDHVLMMDNFNRRAGELSFDEFAWHENRKCNKAVIAGTKFDIGMVCLADDIRHDQHHYNKQGNKTVISTVTNDNHAFDFPAYYQIDDVETPEVLVYTHTYVGQARLGEKVEISGAVECNSATGERRLIVGSTREAAGEYIKVYK